MLRPHNLRLEVAAIQQQFHLLCAPMWVHSHRRVHAPAAAQPWWNEQALPVECLCKVYPAGSVPVYIAQGFHTVNGVCLSCSPVSIMFKNRSIAAKPRWGLNGLRFSAAILARRWWIVVSISNISSPMWCHVLGFCYLSQFPLSYIQIQFKWWSFKIHLKFKWTQNLIKPSLLVRFKCGLRDKNIKQINFFAIVK
jgi:hypothetical protein